MTSAGSPAGSPMPSRVARTAVAAAAAIAVLPATALAQEGDPWVDQPGQPAEQDPGQAPYPEQPPIPPHTEGVPHPATGGGGYCYGGPHPVDTRAVGGPAFDDSQGAHIHEYPPIDLRLFTFRDGCYYFIG